MNIHYYMHPQKGFTLIELLVVIFIIGVLSAVIFPGFAHIREKARDTERVTDVMQIRNALEQYFNRYGEYPMNLNDTDFLDFMPSGLPIDPLGGLYTYTYVSGGDCGSVTGRYRLAFIAENPANFQNDGSVVSIGSNSFCVAP